MRSVRVLKTLDYPPYHCLKCLCGNDTREFYVDLGVDLEWDGAVFLCNVCMEDFANQSGMFISTDKHNEVLMEQAYLVESYTKLLNRVTVWSKAFEKLTSNNLHDFFTNLELILNGPDRPIDSSIGTADSEPTKADESVNTHDIPTESDNQQPEPDVIVPLAITFS